MAKLPIAAASGPSEPAIAGAEPVLAVVTPPSVALPSVAARDIVFVIDTSGSKGGTSIRQAKASLLAGLDRLRPADRFNVIRFDHTMESVFPDPHALGARFCSGSPTSSWARFSSSCSFEPFPVRDLRRPLSRRSPITDTPPRRGRARLFPVKTALRRLLVGLAVLGASGPPASAAEPVFPAAGSLGLAPPPGMTPAERFSGFEHASGASIILVEMPPEAWDQINGRFTPEALAATGFRVAGGRQSLAVNGGEGFVLRGAQTANGLTYTKWVAVVRGAPRTGLVTVQVPETASKRVPAAAVEAALRPIAFRAKASVAEQVAALPYSVGDTAGYRPAIVFAGNGLILTDGPKDVDPQREQPAIVIAPSLGQAAVPAGEEAAFARRLFMTQKDAKDVAVTDEERSTRGAAVVVRLRGSFTDTKTGRPMAATQTVTFENARYLRVIGFADRDKSDALARAERVAASVAMR